MDEVADALRLQLGHAGRSAGDDQNGLVAQHLLDAGSQLGVAVVRRAEHYDLGLRFERGLHALFQILEEGVVLHTDTRAGEEVARELGAGAGHGQMTGGEHERLGRLSAAIHMQTHRLEGHRAAVGIEHARLLPARHGGFGHGVGSDLREVGILVGT